MVKLFSIIVSLFFCFLVSYCGCDTKSNFKNEQNSEIQLIVHILSTKNIRIKLDKNKDYNPICLYRNLRSFILNNILLKIETDKNLLVEITNNDIDENYLFQFEILNQSDLYNITYI